MFGMFMMEIDSFEAVIQKRLRVIEKNWEYVTEFHFREDAPATNNLVENYYSTSLKTLIRKQLRTEEGLRIR